MQNCLFSSLRDDFGSCVYLRLVNELHNGGSSNLPYIKAGKLQKFRDRNVENKQTNKQ